MVVWLVATTWSTPLTFIGSPWSRISRLAATRAAARFLRLVTASCSSTSFARPASTGSPPMARAAAAEGSAPAVAAPAVPGGLTPGQQPQLGCGTDGVCIVKDTSGPSCSGYTSQTTPPSTIKVLVHGSPDTVVTVDFR